MQETTDQTVQILIKSPRFSRNSYPFPSCIFNPFQHFKLRRIDKCVGYKHSPELYSRNELVEGSLHYLNYPSFYLVNIANVKVNNKLSIAVRLEEFAGSFAIAS